MDPEFTHYQVFKLFLRDSVNGKNVIDHLRLTKVDSEKEACGGNLGWLEGKEARLALHKPTELFSELHDLGIVFDLAQIQAQESDVSLKEENWRYRTE